MNLNSNFKPSENFISEGYFELKKSKFYAYIYSVNEEKMVENILSKVKKENKKARHVVYCYNFINENGNNCMKFSNDGEPQGTGTNSIMSMLEKENINGYLVSQDLIFLLNTLVLTPPT